MHIYFLWHVKTEIFTGIKNIKKTDQKESKQVITDTSNTENGSHQQRQTFKCTLKLTRTQLVKHHRCQH